MAEPPFGGTPAAIGAMIPTLNGEDFRPLFHAFAGLLTFR